MTPTPVLLLAGTADAAELAAGLAAEPGIAPTASLAGRVRQPRPLPCPTRVGGFGGAAGLAAELQAGGYRLLVDATHPFAAGMSANAVAAADAAGVDRLRLLRPPWRPGPGDDWHEVDDLEEAAGRLTSLGATCAFLATGRQDVAAFAARPEGRYVLRSIDPPEPPLADRFSVVLARGPFTVAGDLALLRAHAVDAVVARNSGGLAGVAKLDAARLLGLPVVLVRRPPPPPGPVVGTVADALAWISSWRRSSR